MLFGHIVTKATSTLFLLGFGYLIFAYASKQEKSIKTIGRLIGIVIITASLFIGIVSLLGMLGFCKM